MRKVSIEGAATLLEAYFQNGLDVESPIVRLLLDEFGYVGAVSAHFDVDSAVAAAVAEYREFVGSCEAACGEPPLCLLEQVEFVVGERLEAVITFESGDDGLPVLCVTRRGVTTRFTAVAAEAAT